MKRLRILIEDTEVEETPIGWQDITDDISFSSEFNTLLTTVNAELTFTADGYDTLMTYYDDGACSTVDIELQQFVNGYYQSFFDGRIFIKTAEVVRDECTIKVVIEDNSYYATINNNRKIEAFPFASQTKNQEELTPAEFEQVIFFNPNDGTNIALQAPPYSGACYPVFNLFSYLVSFMTDNRLSFASNLFGAGGDFEGLTVTCGRMIREYDSTGTTEVDFTENFPKISFEKLFSETRCNVDIGMYIDYSAQLPVLRIERTSDMRTNATIFRATNVLGIKERFDQEKLYGSIRIGASETTDNSITLFPNNTSVGGWREEQLLVLGECNSSNELSIVNDWMKDHNSIEDCLMNGETDHDKKPFFIMCDVAGGVYTAQQGNLENQLSVFPVFYNLALNGYAVMENYLGGIPNSVAVYLGDRSLLFRATNLSDYDLDDNTGATDELLPFPTDIVDLNNLWDGDYYSVTENGFYTFNVAMTIGVGPTILAYEIYIDRLNAGLVLQTSTLIAADPFVQQEIVDINTSGSIVADVTDRIRIRIHYDLSTAFTLVPPRIYAGATVECTSAPGHGGLVKTFNPDRYPVKEHHWEYPLTFSDYKTISRGLTGQIEFARSGERAYSGWIKNLRFKRFSDEKAQLITYRAKDIPVLNNIDPTIQYVLVTGQLEDEQFAITTDAYGRPFGGSSTTAKIYFYHVGQNVTISIPATHLGLPLHPSVSLALTANGVFQTSTTAQTMTFTIEEGKNYLLQLVYSLAEAGDTYPSIYPTIIPPTELGDLGTAGITLVNPTNPADYTFLWSTGATTQGITAVAGNYSCTVTYTPGTFDNNVITFNIQIPISLTGE